MMLKTIIRDAISYIVLTGAVSRSPRLTLIWLKYIRPLIWGRPSAAIPSPDCDLIISCPCACGSTALTAYLRKWNPSRKIICVTHYPSVVMYCVANDIPCVVLSRSLIAYLLSTTDRWNVEPFTALRHYVNYYKTVYPHTGEVVVVEFERLLVDPVAVVDEINRVYGVNIEAGDGRLPYIRTSTGDSTDE